MAHAAPDRDDHGRDRHGYDHRNDHRDNRRYDDRRGHHDGYAHRPPPGYYHRPPPPPPPRYYGHWERGHRYYGPTYVVNDYRGYRLRPPPRGYHWVRSDNSNFLLVAVATGVILDIATR